MTFASVRIITDDIKRLVAFYEGVMGLNAEWLTDDFAEMPTEGGTLAIASTKTLVFFGENIAAPAENRSAIIEFRVANVDEDFERVRAVTTAIVQPPTTMPWGNRSLLFRDPDGNLVNFFTAVRQ
jgi:predicted enzyme related to lactoylglutathione lyase